MDMVTVWMTDEGPKRIEDLTREEMIACIQYLAGIHQEYFDPKNMHARAIGRVEMIKRGVTGIRGYLKEGLSS